MEQLNVNPLFVNVLPPLTVEEYKGLEEDIKHNGCLDSIKVWNGYIIDGHNRYKICKEHDIPIRTMHMKLE